MEPDRSTRQRRVLRRSVPAGRGPVTARSGLGPIEAVGEASAEVRVEAVIEAAPDDLDAVRLDVETTPGGVRISLDSAAPTWHGWAELHITLPHQAAYEVSSVAGDLRLEGLAGSGRARSQSGSIEALDMEGHCDLGSVSGGVSVRAGSLAFEVRTVSGAIDIRAAPAGPSSAESTAGSIRLELTGPARVTSTSLTGGETVSGEGATVSLGSTAGSVEVIRKPT